MSVSPLSTFRNFQFLIRFCVVAVGISASIFAQRPGTSSAGASDFQVVGYCPPWRMKNIPIEYYGNLDTLVYFGFRPRADGTIIPNYLPEPHDEWQRTENEFTPERKAALDAIRAAHPHLQIEACLRGGEEDFGVVAADASLRKIFVQEVVKMAESGGFDGVNFDYEYPRSPEQIEDFRRLVQETKAALAPRGIFLSVAASGWNAFQAGKKPTIYESVDRVYAMIYDGAPEHAPLGEFPESIRQFLEKRNVPPKKLFAGLPFFGRPTVARDDPAYMKALPYREIVARAAPPVEIPDGDTATVPLESGMLEYNFNGRITLAAKVAEAKAAGIAGVMIWEIGQDIYDDPNKALMPAVRGAIFETGRKSGR